MGYNDGTSWPIAAGHGCVGCSEPDFWDANTPFYGRLPDVQFGDTNLSVDQIGLGVLAATATGFALHGVGKVVQHRRAASREERAAEQLAAGPPEEGE